MAENKPTVKTLYFDINIDQRKIDSEVKKFTSILGEDTKKELSDGLTEAFTEAAKNKATVEALKRNLEDAKKALGFVKEEKQIKNIQQYIEKTKEDLKNLGFGEDEDFGNLGSKDKKENKLKEELKKSLDNLKDIVVRKVSDFFSEILTNVKEYLNEMASYNVSGSIFGTSDARSTMLKYGTSEAQTFGLKKTMSTLKLNSEEDLWYMNPNQREKFAELIGRYTGKYEELANKGFFKDYEEFKLEFMMLKEDLTYDLIQVIVDNKDSIKKVLELSVKAMSALINFFGKVSSFGSGIPTTESILNTYNQKSISNSNAYSFTNNFNVSDTSKAAAQQFSAAIIAGIKQMNNS